MYLHHGYCLDIPFVVSSNITLLETSFEKAKKQGTKLRKPQISQLPSSYATWNVIDQKFFALTSQLEVSQIASHTHTHKHIYSSNSLPLKDYYKMMSIAPFIMQ